MERPLGFDRETHVTCLSCVGNKHYRKLTEHLFYFQIFAHCLGRPALRCCRHPESQRWEPNPHSTDSLTCVARSGVLRVCATHVRVSTSTC